MGCHEAIVLSKSVNSPDAESPEYPIYYFFVDKAPELMRGITCNL